MPQFRDLWVAGHVRLSLLPVIVRYNSTKMTIFLFSVFYKSYIVRLTFLIDSIAHEEFKTMRAGRLAALEEELRHFCLIRSFDTLFFQEETSLSTSQFVMKKTELMPTFFKIGRAHV